MIRGALVIDKIRELQDLIRQMYETEASIKIEVYNYGYELGRDKINQFALDIAKNIKPDLFYNTQIDDEKSICVLGSISEGIDFCGFYKGGIVNADLS